MKPTRLTPGPIKATRVTRRYYAASPLHDSSKVVRIVNEAVRREAYCYYVSPRLGGRLRVVAARTRRGVVQFRALWDGHWFTAQGDWSVEVTP